MQILRSLFFFSTFYFIKNSYALTHTHISKCRSTSTRDPIGKGSAISNYEFENPIYQAKDEGEEYCEVPKELARLLMQEEKAI